MEIIIIYLALFFGGAFFVNAIPHFVNGLSGRKFPTPFAHPPGKGESTALVNILWGFFNFIIAYALLFHVAPLELHSLLQITLMGAGGLVMALMPAWNFGKVYGGN